MRQEALTPFDRLLGLDNKALDTLFRASPAGPIPVGRLAGIALLFPGTRLGRVLAAVVRRLAWQGKVFDPDRGGLRNLLTPLRREAVRAAVAHGDSWVDQRPCVVLDYSRGSSIARLVRDEIRLIDEDTYLGVAWVGRRRVAWFALRGRRAQPRPM